MRTILVPTIPNMPSALDSFLGDLLKQASPTMDFDACHFEVVDDNARSHRGADVHKITCNACRESRWKAAPTMQSPCSSEKKCFSSPDSILSSAARMGMSILEAHNAKKPERRNSKLDFPTLPRRSADSDPQPPHELLVPFAA